jgi:hypothetical protein
LHSICDEKMEGLGVILKNMKRSKLLDFHDAGVLRDDTIITLVNDYYQEFHSAHIVLYENIAEAVKGDDSSHLKVKSWE